MLKRLKRLLTGGARGQDAATSPTPAPPGPVLPPPAGGPGTEAVAPASARPAAASRRVDLAGIDPDAAKIVGRLSRRGQTAYLVGGCVRDLLLGRRPKDFDIATSATPRQVKDLFRNCRIIGRRFK